MRARRVFEEMSKEANSPTRRYSVWYCDHCGRRGHLKDFCWNISGRALKYSNHFKYGSDTGGPACSSESYSEMPVGSAHSYVVSEGVSHTVKVQMTVDEFKRWLKFKKVSACDQTSSVSVGPSGNIPHLAKHIHNRTGVPWLIDSGASRHMVGSHKEFSKYAPNVKGQGMKLADGSTQTIMGTGTVVCGSNMLLSSILHVPSFPINLLSISCSTRELNCATIFYPVWCSFQEIGTGRELGRGSMHDGLYYLDSEISPMVAAALSSSLGQFLLLHHRLGHMPFSTMGKIYPSLFNKIDKEKLGCDACQYGKQTQSSYVLSNNRSGVPLETIHSDVWGPSGVSSLNGYRSFVTFIDCYTRVTWVYVLRNKNDVFECFVDFHNMIRTRYNARMKIFRTDNGTEYVNKEFDEYLSSFGIIHQTTCPGTSEQNGLAERKNRHLLEVTHYLMIAMNVPKYLWSEAVMASAYLINRMPSRMLKDKTPIQCLTGENSYIVPPKVFGCVCFVKDYRPSIGKLDPRALKCIFVGYSGKQNGYKCWCPAERRMFLSMDVVFREHESFYGEPTDLTDVFPELFNNEVSDTDCEIGGDKVEEDNDTMLKNIVVGAIPASGDNDCRNSDIAEIEQEQEMLQGAPDETIQWPRPNEEQQAQVYTRRRNTSERQVQGEEINSQGRDIEAQERQASDVEQEAAVPGSPNHQQVLSPSPSSNDIHSLTYDDLDLPIAHRKPNRCTAGKLPSKLALYDVSNYVSYNSIGSQYKAFIAALDSTIPVPRDWQEAKQHPKWRAAMLEEMTSLEKNNTWITQFKHILGVKPTPPALLAGFPTKTYSRSMKLPTEFDARSQWSGCSTIGTILDQGHCGSCWAFGAVECLQDRFCIHLNMNISLSVNDLLACCGFLCGSGCNGGYPISAWRYFCWKGVVTDECDPYFDQVGCKHPGCEPAYRTPKCEKKCKVQNEVWKEQKHFSVDAYRVHSNPHDIMSEVYNNGPVEVAFIVYEDFAHYKSGVYKHITGGMMGGHAVKLIGWGTSDAGEDYWLLANQWNRGWGDDGYFKIIRGKNECGIEEDVVAGMPSTKNTARNYDDAFGTAIL